MAHPDAALPVDGRLYACRNYQSVFPMPNWGSLAEWKRERKKIRQHLKLCAGLNDQTEAFRARGRVVERFDHDGITVENIRIETLPGLYVMGNLYRPAEFSGKLPLILNPHGHGMHSRTVPLGGGLYSVPHRSMNQALQGFAAFAWSMTAHEDDALQIEHRALLQGPEKQVCNVLGLSMFGVQLNSAIKVLDYLSSRDDIDGRRVGCTGESGGATQTYYLAAVDDRVEVAAPCVMLSGHYQGGCVCENAPLLHLDYSTVHYAGLIAPRPLLLTGCTADWTHHILEREHASLRELYRLYGAEEAIDCLYQDEQHNYNQVSRERVYGWMTRWLKGGSAEEVRIPESKKPVPEPEKLLVHPTPVPPVENAITSKEALIGMWSGLCERPDAEVNGAERLGLVYPEKADILVRNQTPRYAYRGGKLAENLITYGRFSEDSGLTCRFALPKRGKPCLVILRHWEDPDAWQRFAVRPPKAVQQAIDQGNGIIVPLLFGQRSSEAVQAYRAAIEDSYLFTSYNRTAHQHQAGDIVTTVRLAETEMKVSSRRLAIVADRDMGLIGFAAWAFLCSRSNMGPFAGDFRGMDLTDPANWAKHAYLPLVLGAGGVGDLARLCKGSKACLSGVKESCRKLFPRTFEMETKCRSLNALVAAAADIG